jgi:hypothetical protein
LLLLLPADQLLLRPMHRCTCFCCCCCPVL